jgi:hypothetical protein
MFLIYMMLRILLIIMRGRTDIKDMKEQRYKENIDVVTEM